MAIAHHALADSSCVPGTVTARRTEVGSPLGTAASAIGFTLVDGFWAASTVVLNLNPAENNCKNCKKGS